jgi:tetratricopeptide (TPR) repeat protein
VTELFGHVEELEKILLRNGDAARLGDFAAMQQLFDVTLRVSGGRGLVIVVDDCHWLDSPSLRFLAYLAARIRETDVLLVLATRPDSGPGRQPIIDQILNTSHVTSLSPQLLSRSASDQLLVQLLPQRPDATFSAVCFRETAGNPLILVELAAAVTDARLEPSAENAALVGRIGAHAVKHRVSEQLSTLTDAERLVLHAVAVLGDGARQAQLAALAGPGAPVADAVTVLRRAGLVRGNPNEGVEFVHPLIRAAVYENIEPLMKAELHQRAAELLSQAHAGVETVAAHYVAVAISPDSVSVDRQQSPELVLMRAATEAMRRGSPESALRYLRRAMAMGGDVEHRQDMLLAAGRAAFQVDLPNAVEYLGQALQHVEDPEQRLDLAGTLVASLLLTGRVDEALEVIRHEQRVLPTPVGNEPDPHAGKRTYLDTLVAMVAANNPSSTELDREVRDLLQRPPLEGFGGRSLDGVLALYQATRAEPEAVERAIRATAAGVVMTGEGRRGPVPISVSVLLAADRPEALAHLDRAVERSRNEGSLLAASGAYAYRAHARLLRGDLAAAYNDAVTARWSTSILGLRNKSFLAQVLANTCLALDRKDEAADALAWSEVLAAPADRPFTYFALAAYASWHRLDGDPQRGLEFALRAGERYAVGGGINPAQVPWRSEAALCLQQLGQVEEAFELASEEISVARKWTAPRALGRALRVLAAVGGSVELLDEAIEVLRPSIARLELAECLLARGAASADHAAEDLTEAAGLAAECGAAALSARIDEARVQ